MPIQTIRMLVIQAYAGNYKNTAWERKVNKMSDNQVIAIFKNLKIRGKL